MAAISPAEAGPVAGERYANPYLAGVALGLVLLASFLIAGRGLGVVGAVRTLIGDAMKLALPGHISANAFYADEIAGDASMTERYWIVVEVFGLCLGAMLSARWAGRARLQVTHGPQIGDRGRLVRALAGGGVMGAGAALARGCTSGLALSGGALLCVGSWVFMLSLFAGGYAAAWFVRRQWV
jgi:hypothetical protein